MSIQLFSDYDNLPVSVSMNDFGAFKRAVKESEQDLSKTQWNGKFEEEMSRKEEMDKLCKNISSSHSNVRILETSGKIRLTQESEV